MNVTEARLEELAGVLADWPGVTDRPAWAALREAGEVLAALAEDRLEVAGRCTCETFGPRVCARCGPVPVTDEVATVTPPPSGPPRPLGR